MTPIHPYVSLPIARLQRVLLGMATCTNSYLLARQSFLQAPGRHGEILAANANGRLRKDTPAGKSSVLE
jgi:hypothetical protein